MVVEGCVDGRVFAGNGVEDAGTDSSKEQIPTAYGSPVLVDLVRDISLGTPWASALVGAIGRWAPPRETVDGEKLTYLLGGEAFDWLLLAERLLRGVEQASPGLVPTAVVEQLLVSGQLPNDVTESHFREALGFDKYRAHLNFFYGVVVEEALWLAVEREVQKERGVRGLHHPFGVLDLVYQRLYRADLKTLMRRFRLERDERPSVKFTMTEWKEFTYSLFKHRVGNQDSARIASDTRKGLTMLEELWGVAPEAQGAGTVDPLWGDVDD
jgi:hypothetical protein